MHRLAQEVLETRYFQPGENWEALCRRVASSIGLVDTEVEAFYELLCSKRFLPNSPCLRNAGVGGCLAACFVLPLEDSRDAIFRCLQEAVEVQAFGGGTGYDFGALRPKGSRVRSTGGTSCGPLGFMRVFDLTIGEVIRQGGVRPGAQMGVMPIWHPDIQEFITSKRSEGNLTHFNLSVAVTDEFMQKVLEGKPFEWPLSFGGEVYKTVPGLDLWNLLVEGAWANGEPGLIFIDTINRANPLAAMQVITCTNPCGEQPLAPYESCILGSINLASFVQNGTVDWPALESATRLATRFLDRCIDASPYPLPQIEAQTKLYRKIGLGVMGFADALMGLGIRYGSYESVKFAENVMAYIDRASKSESRKMLEEMGLAEGQSARAASVLGRRNATTTTIAPTGTISLIAGVSAGIEPVFAAEFEKVCLGKTIKVRHPLADNPHFVTASEVPLESHIAIQAAFQKYTDNAVSKTLNAPASTTKEDVDRAFKTAYQSGCKGITFYRQGSRRLEAQKAGTPELMRGWRQKVKTGEGTLWVHVYESGVYREIWVSISKEGSLVSSMTDALGRVMTLALKHGASWEELEKQLRGIGGGRPAWWKNQLVLSPPDAIAKVIRQMILQRPLPEPQDLSCPSCGSQIYAAEGCATCPACGWSGCE